MFLYNEYECNAECKSINKQHHIKCYSQLNKRIPSYCDRVLCFYNNDFAKKYVVKSLNTKTILDKFSIHSDHNPVSVSIVIQDIFYSKYIKYYQGFYAASTQKYSIRINDKGELYLINEFIKITKSEKGKLELIESWEGVETRSTIDFNFKSRKTKIEVKTTIEQTIKKVKKESFDRINYIKLKNLSRTI
jgi:hypothetical protein